MNYQKCGGLNPYLIPHCTHFFENKNQPTSVKTRTGSEVKNIEFDKKGLISVLAFKLKNIKQDYNAVKINENSRFRPNPYQLFSHF